MNTPAAVADKDFEIADAEAHTWHCTLSEV
jgi:hypothetical protein